jgi:hypothetical protein
MKTRSVLFLCVALTVTSVGVSIYSGIQSRREQAVLRKKVKRFDDFCRQTRVSVMSDLTLLKSGNASSQEIVYRRYNDDRAHSGFSNIKTCLGDTMPVVEECGRDYQCFTARTAIYYEALEKSY